MNGTLPLPRRRLFCYSAAELPMSMASTPVSLFLPAFYTQDLGLGLASVGAILMLSRCWDFITDPVIGYLSDRTKSRIGRRKPWLLASIPVVMLAVYHLFLPPAEVDNFYLLIWIMVLWLGWTFFNIPYFAWGAELSPLYTERTRITAWRTVFGLCGTLLAILIPVASQFLFDWGGKSGELMYMIGIAAMVMIPTFVGTTLITVPEQPGFVPARLEVLAGLKIMWTNRPFRRVLFAFATVALAQALVAPLFVLFITHVIGDPTAAAKVVFFYFVGSLVGVPLWTWLAEKTDKHICWMFSVTMFAMTFPPFMLLGEGDLLLAGLLQFLIGVAGGNIAVVPASMKADVIDLDKLESGENQAGLFFAAWSTAHKLVNALGVGISLPALSLLGFDPRSVNSPDELFALQAWFSLVPVVFCAISFALVVKYPITRERYAQIRAELDRREAAGG